jgi:hypothetical protein
MKKLLVIVFALSLAMPALAVNYTDYTQPFDVEPGKTMGLWHFDEVAGSNTVYDATANNNDGVIDPGATAYGYGPLDPNVSYAPSMAGFDTGTNTWLVNSTNQNVGTWVVAQDKPGEGNSSLFIDGDFSIDFWMNAKASSAGSWNHQILTKGSGAVFGIQFDSQLIKMYWYGVGVGWNPAATANSTNTIALNEWHHVSIRVDNKLGALEDKAYIEIWIDGVLDSAHSDRAAIQDDASLGNDLTIHGTQGGHPFNAFKGQLDELRISNYYIPEPTTMSVFALALFAFLKRKK